MRLLLSAVVFLITFAGISAQDYKPTFNEGLIHFSKLIAEGRSAVFGNNLSDPAYADSIYSAAIRYYNGDISEALLCLTFATLPFNAIPLSVPIFNTKLNLPLPSAAEKIFQQKNINLPGKIFFDSPSNDFGDKDKLAHFFGNAFLSYNFPVFNLSKFMGIFVELFEYTFKVDGSVDKRDLIANALGDLFGKSLNENTNIMPSQVFSVYSLLYFKSPL